MYNILKIDCTSHFGLSKIFFISQIRHTLEKTCLVGCFTRHSEVARIQINVVPDMSEHCVELFILLLAVNLLKYIDCAYSPLIPFTGIPMNFKIKS